MVRKTDIRRNTGPASPILFSDENQKAQLEAKNGLLQFDEVLKIIETSLKAEKAFKLKPSTITHLHRIAIQDIYACAGNYRTQPVDIHGTDHLPPRWEDVPTLVEEMCDYVNENWDKSPIHLAAYAMWRLNWIHPFMGGNGRTSRVVSYLVLCIRLEYNLPITKTIPEQIVEKREPYYEALDSADIAYKRSAIDVGKMEELLSNMLASQLYELINKAKEDCK